LSLLPAEEALNGMVEGKLVLTAASSGDALRARQRRPSLRFVWPTEGGALWVDHLVIPRGAPEREAALAFIDYMLEPAQAARQSAYVGFPPTGSAALSLMDPALREAPEMTLATIFPYPDFREICDRQTVDLQRSIWEDIVLDLRPVRP
jgi:spermidine/putrescine transport system substrate-binding protein